MKGTNFIKKNKLLVIPVIIGIGVLSYIFIPKGIVAVKTQQAHKVVALQPKKAEDFLKKLQTANYDLKLGSNPSEDEILADMNAMAHQKIRAKDELGHIPMIPSTIN
jgi:hypothetical protein